MTQAERAAAVALCAVDRRSGNSNAPWRIVHPPTGKTVTGPLTTFHHPMLGPIPITCCAWHTRAEAESALALLAQQIEAAGDLRRLAALVGDCVDLSKL